MSNTSGKIFRLTTFGESHSKAVGGIIDGCPAGIQVDYDLIDNEIERRKTGRFSINSQRTETDEVELLSGIFNGITLGTPIGFIVRNSGHQSADYEELKNIYRPSHADFTYQSKYGIRDYRGGGRASARETISRVVAGSFAKMILKTVETEVISYVSQVGKIVLEKSYRELDLSLTYSNSVGCPDMEIADLMEKEISATSSSGDTLGGIVSTVVKNVPLGLGEPIFAKLNSLISSSILSIPAVVGISFGDGIAMTSGKGSELNDSFIVKNKNITTKTNHSGGIQGGISNGNDIFFKTYFHPVSSIKIKQATVNMNNEEIEFSISGRHDACIVNRALPIVEAMTALVLADLLLLRRTNKL